MVAYSDSDGDVAGSNAETAIEILNSGKINFEVLDSEGNDVLTVRIVEINSLSDSDFSEQ